MKYRVGFHIQRPRRTSVDVRVRRHVLDERAEQSAVRAHVLGMLAWSSVASRFAVEPRIHGPEREIRPELGHQRERAAKEHADLDERSVRWDPLREPRIKLLDAMRPAGDIAPTHEATRAFTITWPTASVTH